MSTCGGGGSPQPRGTFDIGKNEDKEEKRDNLTSSLPQDEGPKAENTLMGEFYPITAVVLDPPSFNNPRVDTFSQKTCQPAGQTQNTLRHSSQSRSKQMDAVDLSVSGAFPGCRF